MSYEMVLLYKAYKLLWSIRSQMSNTYYGRAIHETTNEIDQFLREREKMLQSKKLDPEEKIEECSPKI